MWIDVDVVVLLNNISHDIVHSDFCLHVPFILFFNKFYRQILKCAAVFSLGYTVVFWLSPHSLSLQAYCVEFVCSSSGCVCCTTDGSSFKRLV